MSLRLSELKVGQTHSELLVDNLTRGLITGYAIAIGDAAPEHSDEVYCTEVAGLPSIFGHGMFTAGMTTRMLTNWAGAGSIKTFSVRFGTTRAWPGDTLTATATVEQIDSAEKLVYVSYAATNSEGRALITGNATLRADP